MFLLVAVHFHDQRVLAQHQLAAAVRGGDKSLLDTLIAEGAVDAAREARLAVRCDAACGPVDWAVPVVYARDPGSTL